MVPSRELVSDGCLTLLLVVERTTMIDEKTEYATKDLYLAALIKAKKINIKRLESKTSPYYFIFEDPETCAKLEETYWNAGVEVNAKDYSDAIKDLKARVHSVINKG